VFSDLVQVTIFYDTGVQLMQDLLVDLCHIHRENGGKDNLQLLCGVVETVLFASLVAMHMQAFRSVHTTKNESNTASYASHGYVINTEMV